MVDVDGGNGRFILSGSSRRRTGWGRWVSAQAKVRIDDDGLVTVALEVWPGKRPREVVELRSDGSVRPWEVREKG